MVYRVTNRGLARRRARRDLLIDVARNQFGEHGYHDTSVPMIVEAGRTSIGAFYIYFKSKEAVFIAVLNAVEHDLSASLNDAQNSAGNDVASRMRAAVEALVKYLATHPADARILLLDAPALSGEIHTAWRSVVESHTRSVENAIRALSPPAVVDFSTAATCWVGSVTEAVLRWLERPETERPSCDALARAIVTFNSKGIGIDLYRR